MWLGWGVRLRGVQAVAPYLLELELDGLHKGGRHALCRLLPQAHRLGDVLAAKAHLRVRGAVGRCAEFGMMVCSAGLIGTSTHARIYTKSTHPPPPLTYHDRVCVSVDHLGVGLVPVLARVVLMHHAPAGLGVVV